MSKSDVIPSSMGSKRPDSCAIFSGGMDSTVLVYDMLTKGYTPHLLSFNYGQRHSKELKYAERTADKLHLRHDIIDLTGITYLISNSALTAPDVHTGDLLRGDHDMHKAIEVPEGHYAEDTMKATVVPNRNMIMLAIACGVAVNNKYRTVGTGVHGGDHFIYPDCRPEFIYHMGQVMLQGNEGFHNFHVGKDPIMEVNGKPMYGAKPLYTPFIQKSKADIAYLGFELGVPFHETWSCYKGGEKHCGRCGTCVERLEALDDATRRFNPNRWKDFLDRTEYEDREYWKQAVTDTH